MRTKSFLTFMLAVVTAICFTSCADDNDEGWRAVSAADYKVFTDAKAAFLNNPQNVGTPMYETLIYLTEKPQAVKAQEVEGGTNYEFYFSICNVSIAKGILDEVGYIVNTSMRSDANSHGVIGATVQGAYALNDATSQKAIIQNDPTSKIYIQDLSMHPHIGLVGKGNVVGTTQALLFDQPDRAAFYYYNVLNIGISSTGHKELINSNTDEIDKKRARIFELTNKDGIRN